MIEGSVVWIKLKNHYIDNDESLIDREKKHEHRPVTATSPIVPVAPVPRKVFVATSSSSSGSCGGNVSRRNHSRSIDSPRCGRVANLLFLALLVGICHAWTPPHHHHRYALLERKRSMSWCSAVSENSDGTAAFEFGVTERSEQPLAPWQTVVTRDPQAQQFQLPFSIVFPNVQPQQQQQVGSGVVAPLVIGMLAIPSLFSPPPAGAAGLWQEAVDNLAFAILPESTPDLISVVLGEFMGYATYFVLTTMVLAAILASPVKQMVLEDEPPTSPSLFHSDSEEEEHFNFAPVHAPQEQDQAMVPCAFVVEQAVAGNSPQSWTDHLDWVEVFFDVTKWLSYFVLQSELTGTTSLDNFSESVVFGFVAGFGAKFYADILYRHFQLGPTWKRDEMVKRDWPVLCLLEGASAASLFAVYELVSAPAQEWLSLVCGIGV